MRPCALFVVVVCFSSPLPVLVLESTLPAGTLALTEYKIQEQQQAEVHPSVLCYNKIQEQQQGEV